MPNDAHTARESWQLEESARPLWDVYDVAMLDLDGVVYIGPDAVPGAADHLAAGAAAGMHLAYVTNNASRPPRDVAKHLSDLGIPAVEDDVVTSAQAAARMLSEDLPAASPVFVIGGPGLVEALEERGLRPVSSSDEAPVAVVNGYYAELRWRTVSEGAILIRRGLPWVATNTDLSVPTPLGRGPGNGVIVEALRRFTEREPRVAGKPQPPLFDETHRRVGGTRPLVVGDRLDTDIEGARNGGYDSLLVLTGVTGVEELVTAPAHRRPDYIALDLGGLGVPHPVPRARGEALELGGWSARVRGDHVELDGEGRAVDWWRLVAVTAWRHHDATGGCVVTDDLTPPR